MEPTGRIDRGDGVELAWAHQDGKRQDGKPPDGTRLDGTRQDGRGPTVVFLPGFRSDMTGDKATSLAAFCAARGQAMLRFDYSGHGASGGRFEDGTIGRWADDALTVIDRLSEGKLVLVGSSMGGWIALLAARARPERVAALIGIAAAPDFTEALMWAAMDEGQRAVLMRDGVWPRPSQYGESYPITRALIEDGRRHLLLDAPIALDCPVRLLHGQADPDVPWETSLRIAERLTGTDVQVTLVKDGDHRLSRPQDLALLHRTLAPLLQEPV
ncbi:MAG: alpha/beta hydrolase [Acetobacteraceae bacterium]